jgi:hypothetical protein
VNVLILVSKRPSGPQQSHMSMIWAKKLSLTQHNLVTAGGGTWAKLGKII